MSIVVQDHVHLGDAGDLVVDLDAEEAFFGEVVPVLIVFDAVGVVVVGGLAAHAVEGVEKEPAGTAGGIEDEIIGLWLHHFHREGDDFTRGEILAEVALEKVVHELLEGDALGVEVGLAEANGLHVGNEGPQGGVVNTDGVGKDLGVFLLGGFVDALDTFGEFAARLVRLDLELVRLAVPTRGFFVLNLDEEKFAEFAESHRR